MGRIEKTIFLSYRRTNFYTALAVYQDLTAHGYDVFFDFQNIDSGNFATAILENIEARAHFVLVLSSSALERCNEPNDWLRREIETAMDLKRNIVPLMMEGFDFGSPNTVQALSGKLATLNTYNGLRLYSEYFFDAMEKLRTRFLNVALEDVRSREVSAETKEVNEAKKTLADEAPLVEVEKITAEEWFERAYTLQETKIYDEAFRCYTEAIRLAPALIGAHNNLGNLLADLKRHDEAEVAYRKAIEINPRYATAYYNLGTLLNDLKHYNEAEAAYRKATEINPNFTSAYYNLGILLSNLKNYEEAEVSYRKAIEINPDDVRTYYNLACLKSLKESAESAFEYLEKASKLEGFNPSLAWNDPDLQWIRDDPRFVQIVGAKPE